MKMMLIFSKKFFVWGRWTMLGPKKVHPHNFGLAVRIFLKFCTIKGTNRKMKVIIMVCTKKNLFRANGLFWARKWHILITLDGSKNLFLNFAESKGLIGT